MTSPAPAWLTPGATVYEVSNRGAYSGYRLNKVTVVRLTGTQAVVAQPNGFEIKYRIKDLRCVGVDAYRSLELAAPDDSRVTSQLRRDQASAAMRPLWEILKSLEVGAALHNADPDQVRRNATLIRDAAQAALNNMPAPTEETP